MCVAEFFWDRMADGYDQHMEAYGMARIRTVDLVQQRLRSDDAVMDFGCGTGVLACEIAGRVQAVRGIDLSSKMIRAARRKAEAGGLRNAEFLRSTINERRWKPETFDAVVAVGILHLLANPSRAVRRIHELLKPGGWLLSSTPCRMEDSRYLAWISNAAFFLGRIGVMPVMRFFRTSELEGVIRGGNFRIDETQDLPFGESGDPQYVFARFIAAQKA